MCCISTNTSGWHKPALQQPLSKDSPLFPFLCLLLSGPALLLSPCWHHHTHDCEMNQARELCQLKTKQFPFPQVSFDLDEFPDVVHCGATRTLVLAQGREQQREWGGMWAVGVGKEGPFSSAAVLVYAGLETWCICGVNCWKLCAPNCVSQLRDFQGKKASFKMRPDFLGSSWLKFGGSESKLRS